MIIYQAFVESELEVPRHLAGLCTTCISQSNEFKPRTVWCLSNAFTYKDLDPIPQFRATAKLGAFRFRESFWKSSGHMGYFAKSVR
jgi:hypothetical protein